MPKLNDNYDDNSKFYRLLTILNLIPIEPKFKSTSQIFKDLQNKDFSIAKRTLERDLSSLEYELGFIKHEKIGNQNNWSFRKNNQFKMLPSIDPETALVFKMIEKNLSSSFPNYFLSRLEPYFESSSDILDSLDPKLKRLSEKIRIVSDTVLKEAKIEDGVLENIYRAISENKKIEVKYSKRGNEDNNKTSNKSPLGIFIRNGVSNLIYYSEENIRYKPIHRFKEINLLNEEIEVPQDFNIDNYLNSEELTWGLSNESINFVGIFSESIKHILYETPLNSEQVIKELDNGDIELSATINDSMKFRWWLLSLSNQVIVKKPTSIKNYIKNELKKALMNY
jgi:hypothetical protein